MELPFISFVLMFACIILMQIGWIGPEKKSVGDLLYNLHCLFFRFFRKSLLGNKSK